MLSAPQRLLLPALLALAACSSLPIALPATGLGQPAPEVELTDARTGEPVELAAYRGRTVILNVWATWCGPCRVEMPALDAIQHASPDRVAVLFASSESPEVIRAWMADRPAEGRHLHVAPEALRGPYALAESMRPVTFLIDAEGILRDRVVGAQTEEAFRQRVNDLQAPSSSS